MDTPSRTYKAPVAGREISTKLVSAGIVPDRTVPYYTVTPAEFPIAASLLHSPALVLSLSLFCRGLSSVSLSAPLTLLLWHSVHTWILMSLPAPLAVTSDCCRRASSGCEWTRLPPVLSLIPCAKGERIVLSPFYLDPIQLFLYNAIPSVRFSALFLAEGPSLRSSALLCLVASIRTRSVEYSSV